MTGEADSVKMDPVFDRLITGECRLDALPDTMARLAAPGGALCEVVRY